MVQPRLYNDRRTAILVAASTLRRLPLFCDYSSKTGLE
jgi:hypothetical protein